ncbi:MULTISPECIES: beta-ketoacyl-ACP synthase II [unclassified Streptomyces]|uniref:beta-ketoacyl-ACP synthase II n=1 Tax=unclassified Streptomyces TaxID=2593676 RepID=UPI0006AE0656|nr:MULTISPECIES: beta-ketoacyl-ACP synthase II [unclassified Streptomyces]KOU17917.1 3-oxoacyl-ACP synthase [Streptomyces sp. WM6349]KOV46181.1 3-oxoacyl-ACP synthase [Streptomyces sp. H036]GLV93842.1 3-oxoacyl-[acyl-carrier-protein] synthase 2 [Streptomyces lavendulae subsp. lavendulae]
MTQTRAGAPERRVVITGSGVVSPIGCTTEEFWASATAGRSGIRTITRYDGDTLPTRFAGEVVDFDPKPYMPNKQGRRLDRYAQFALAAALQAVRQAGLEIDGERAVRTAVLVGSGYGPGQLMQSAIHDLRDHGRRRMTPYLASSGSLDSAAGEIAFRLGARGPSGATATACATGATCIGDAMRMIRHGYADVVIAGGADDAVNPLDLAAAANAGALSRRDDEPGRASRPFDRARDGFVMGAGAGVVVLESAEHARRRGATVLAELAGYGATTDAYHSTHPHPEGLAARQAMTDALDDAGVRPEEIDHISAHGTGTQLNDRIESASIRAVFGRHALRVPISSLKSMTGHMIGAAGAVELIAAAHTIRDGIVPPTVNCDDPEDTELDYVPHTARPHAVRTVLSNSFGFGGHNAVLVLRAPSGPSRTPSQSPSMPESQGGER